MLKQYIPIGLVFFAAAASLGQTPAAPLKRVEEAEFGKTADGTVVKIFTLRNAKGMTAKVITYGAGIDGVEVPDKDGKFANVIAGPATWDQTPRFGMFAQTVAPVANRIAGAKFTLHGKEYTFTPDRTGNLLHSGAANFGTKVWQGKALPPKDHEGSAELTYTSKDGDGGFPGPITLKLTYSLNDDNEFRLDYVATTEKATPINVTNHAYFNLAGFDGTMAAPVADEELWVDADKYLLADSGLIPTGEMAPVKDTPLDFTKPTAIGSRVAQLAPMRNYDHAFVLNSGGGKMAKVASVRDPASGRMVEVITDQPGLQVYTGQRTGVTLETQHHPDSIHRDNFPTTVVKPGETFKTSTIYAFSAK